MPLHPEYLAVHKTFRYYRQVGISLSNTWVGRSQAFNNVYEVLNSKEGDTLADLPGGLFMIDTDGLVSPILLRAPTPLFEKSMGPSPEYSEILRFKANGTASLIDKPDIPIDYAEANERCRNELEPHREQFIVLEASPELQAYRNGAKYLFETWSDDTQPSRDFDHWREPTVGSLIEDNHGNSARLTWCYLPDFYRLKAIQGRLETLEPLYERKTFSKDELEEVLNGNFKYGTAAP